MNYTITQFNPADHSIVVSFESSSMNKNVKLGLTVPIIGGEYVTGSELDSFITSVLYNFEASQAARNAVSNASAIQSLVQAEVAPAPKVYTDAEIDIIVADAARKDRDIAMKLTDWTQINDVKLTAEQVAAWATYREALRNISTLSGFPRTFVWPIPPEAMKKSNGIQLQADGTLIDGKNNYKLALKKTGLSI